MEQTNGAEQINNAIQQLNNVTQQNAANADVLVTSSQRLSSEADRLKEIISFFKTDGRGLQNFKASAPKKATKTTVKSTHTTSKTTQVVTPKAKINPKGGVNLDLGSGFSSSGSTKDDDDYERF
jgi:methyl-accepting chemotaxis protein